ncbi:GFA family protein [Alteromonas lipotrueiana]|uniref:GFA family protein n=1 Tax=Alteromonas lipotrueiana TaxID=2803815 RepID=UPI0031B88CCE
MLLSEDKGLKMKGSCNCKSISFTSNQEIKAVVNCHCNLCRKMNGSSFSTYVVVPEYDFSITGQDLSSFKVSENATKHFCSRCGTPIFNTNPRLGGVIIVHLGAIDSQFEISPAVNIFCESQLEWVNKIDGLKRFEQGLA